MIDAEAFAQHTKTPLDRDDTELDPLPKKDFSDRFYMLCSPTSKAYGLRTKRWGKHLLFLVTTLVLFNCSHRIGEVYVDGISDIRWDENAFEHLVLETETKQLVKSFVSAQIGQNRPVVFDDFVEGKGTLKILS